MKDKLTEIVREQLGCESGEDFEQTLKDVCRGGANAGFSGFTYSAEMLEFYKTNRDLILKDQKEFAVDLGTNFLDMVTGFICLKDAELTTDEIADIIYGKNYEHEMSNMVVDALCWSVLEKIAFEHDS